MRDTVDLVRRSLSAAAAEAFDRRVEAGAEVVLEALRSGELDNADPTIGLELECYVVDGDGRLATLPEGCLVETPVNRELGRHNLEVNTPAAVLSGPGVEAQAETVREHLAVARRVAASHDRRVVLDAMWTVPPAEGTRGYLGDVATVDGIVLAANMHASARYHALDNDILRAGGGTVTLDLPGVHVQCPSILAESLATSIQPHLQVPHAASFPAYHNAAIRTMGPVLALATNAPFLPADLYDGADPEAVLASTYHELRVPVFEQSINAGQTPGKVRFPEDVSSAEDVVRRIVEDDTVAPFLREWTDDVGPGGDEHPDDPGRDGAGKPFEDAFWEFGHKHGTYWRWLRGVVGGDYVDADNDERSLRLEYRPLPTQPSVIDLVGVQCLVAGLVHGLVRADHPLPTLPWADARETFYAVVEDGLDADLHWVTADGEHTTDRATIYREVFDLARSGLAAADVPPATVETYLRPIERRWEERTTPSRWKLARVRDAVADGATLPEAIEAMQRAYVAEAGARRPFVDWD